jgi:transcriptional regulator of NAD metabolism
MQKEKQASNEIKAQIKAKEEQDKADFAKKLEQQNKQAQNLLQQKIAETIKNEKETFKS